MIPIESIRIAKPAVKYFVVNQANALGSFSAQSVKTTVQTGNRFVSAPDTLMYVSNHVGSASSTAAAAAWATTAARGFSTFAWSLTDLRSFYATPRPLLTALRTGRAARGAGAGAKAAAAAKSAQRSLFIVAGRAFKLQTAQE